MSILTEEALLINSKIKYIRGNLLESTFKIL